MRGSSVNVRQPGFGAGRALVAAAIGLLCVLLVPAAAMAHVERSSYWPDPAPDRSIRPAAGGDVPKARSLASALRPSARGTTRVVCQRNSLALVRADIADARRNGYKLRPSERLRRLGAGRAAVLERINTRLFKQCEYRSIQAAIFDTHNNDRIVVMPGEYTEDPSRRSPTNDPECDQYREPSENGAGAATYRFQVKCPNDQSLIYLQGRKLTDDPVPFPALEDRHGIPDAGRCIRCNVQIEGSGVVPTDVVIEAAADPRTELGEAPKDYVKDVGMRVDRADGFVIRNVTFAHAREHGLYIHETDGYLVDRVKWYYNGFYGLLAFTSDHGLTQNCEGVGHGDSAVYPGAAPETGEQRNATIESDTRANATIRFCDVHHNTLGYSGTMANGTRVVHNQFYGNGTGITTDSFFAGGHPGYPQDSAEFAHNNIFSNNFNSFAPDSDVVPHVPVPVGVGILIAGGNNNNVHHNRIWDNWRRGTMLVTLPDIVSNIDTPEQVRGLRSTSHRNRYHDNVMGRSPSGKVMPNGVDFWFDDFPGGEDNCWYRNGQVTTDPPGDLLSKVCDNITPGLTYLDHAPEILGCLFAVGVAGEYDASACPWFATPAEPGTQAAAAEASSAPMTARQVETRTELLDGLCDVLGSTTLSCQPFRGQRP